MNSASPKVSTKDAMTLLSLRSAPTSPSRLQTGEQRWIASPLGLAIARFEGRDFEYIMRLPQRTVTVGRSSSRGQVDINMEPSSFVSRCHFQVFCLPNDHSRFFITCSGKNGIFVDGVFQRKGAEPMELPSNCALRFPSTTIKINFQSLYQSENGSCRPDVVPKPLAAAEHQTTPPMLSRSLSLSSVPTPVVASNPLALGTSQSHPGNLLKAKRFLPSLNINMPRLVGFVSPCPSPTGTISAANSCPTSPRSGGGRLSINFDLPEQEETPSSAPAGEDSLAANFEPHSVEPSGVGDSSRSSAKPLFSYAQLIVQAINSQADRQLTLSGIYAYISKHYPYYKLTDKGWQNSIRHNLSLNRFFVKVPRSQEEPGKGSFWRIEPSSETKLVEQAFKKRRQRVGNSFASPNVDVISSSAPVSPNHLDESSPVDGSSLHSLDDQSRQQTIFTKPQIQHLITTQASKMHPTGISLPQKLLHFPKEGTQKDGTQTVKPELQMPPASAIHDQFKSMTTSSTGLSTGDLQNVQNVIASSSNNSIPLGFPLNAHGDSHAFLLINQSQNNMVSPKVHSEGSILPITVIQTLSQQQAQPQQSNSPQMLSQSLPTQQVQLNSSQQQQPMSAILLQKLLQQGAMVLGKVSGDAQQQQHPGVYSLTPGGLQLFLGASIGNQQQSQHQQQQQQFILIPPGVVTPKIEPDDKMKETKPQLLMALPQHQQLLHNLQQHQHFLNFQQQQHENGLSYQVKNEKPEGFESQQTTSFLSSTSVSSQQILAEKAMNGPSKAPTETGCPCEVPPDPQSSESSELLGKKRKQDRAMDDSSGKKLKN